jgi:hypothetical protein
MKNKKDIEKLADEALNSFDDIEPVEVNDFIFTRIQNRMAARQPAPVKARLVTMYRLTAMLVVFTLLNIGSYYFLAQPKNVKATVQKTSGIEAFADDYNLQPKSYNY